MSENEKNTLEVATEEVNEVITESNEGLSRHLPALIGSLIGGAVGSLVLGLSIPALVFSVFFGFIVSTAVINMFR